MNIFDYLFYVFLYGYVSLGIGYFLSKFSEKLNNNLQSIKQLELERYNKLEGYDRN